MRTVALKVVEEEPVLPVPVLYGGQEGLSVVTVERSHLRVVLAAWPGKEHVAAARTLQALGYPAEGRITIDRFQFQMDSDGIQRYVEPKKVKRYGFR